MSKKQAPKMIDVYSWATPNGHKVHIMLEECGYRLGKDWIAYPIDIGAGDQFEPDFLKISPNNKIPAIVDPNGPDGKPISIFESGAILLYLAAKTGKFLPKSTRAKYDVLQWLMFQMGGLGPMLGQTITSEFMPLKKLITQSIAIPMKQSAYMASWINSSAIIHS